MRRYRVVTSAECPIVMVVMLVVTSGLGSFFDSIGLDGNGMVLVSLLWKLCDYFVPIVPL
jgi:hypothetical protein